MKAENKEIICTDSDNEENTEEIAMDKQTIDDFEEARNTYKDLIEQGKNALIIATSILEGSEHPRAVEVFANLMKSVSDITDRMVELQKTKYEVRSKIYDMKRKTLQQIQQIPDGTVLVQHQNNIVLNSTNDMLKAIKNKEV